MIPGSEQTGNPPDSGVIMKTIKLYSFTLPFALLPLMDFSVSQIPKYLKGVEFRTFISELVTQLLSGITDAGIIALFQSALVG
jgi:hypothetical protein